MKFEFNKCNGFFDFTKEREESFVEPIGESEISFLLSFFYFWETKINKIIDGSKALPDYEKNISNDSDYFEKVCLELVCFDKVMFFRFFERRMFDFNLQQVIEEIINKTFEDFELPDNTFDYIDDFIENRYEYYNDLIPNEPIINDLNERLTSSLLFKIIQKPCSMLTVPFSAMQLDPYQIQNKITFASWLFKGIEISEKSIVETAMKYDIMIIDEEIDL